MKFLLISALFIAISNSNASAFKPPLPEQTYVNNAKNTYGLDMCVQSDRIDLNIAAWGRNLIEESLVGYQVDPVKAEALLQKLVQEKPPVPDSWCKASADVIVQILQSNEAKEQQGKADQRRESVEQIRQLGQAFQDFGNSVRPRFTNCTKYYGQVRCTAY